ncbi:transcription antitermination factor NusB [Belnapia sp. T6]|uniref:Transcription antitermination protein NusB n=2 Tax=Belnapia mucosa TaxID=2804532 RepID=A0ABS1V1D1_9PROT|nr:transcription antitermination factor NusB [Belnapia mucosa]
MEAEGRAADPAAPATNPGPAQPARGGGQKAKGKPGKQPQRGRPRTGARVAAVQALYQSEQTGESPEAVIQQFLVHRIGGGFEEGGVPEADRPLFGTIVRTAAKNGEKLDEILTRHLDPDWPLPRLDPVLRALLRAACAEFSEGTEPPARVVINEYLDIAHGFFSGDEPRFANGVLDALARNLRPGEFTAGRR